MRRCITVAISDYIELPYGGVLNRLGEYSYRLQLGNIEIGFEIIPASCWRFYYTDIGLEIDVMYAGDEPWDVVL